MSVLDVSVSQTLSLTQAKNIIHATPTHSVKGTVFDRIRLRLKQPNSIESIALLLPYIALLLPYIVVVYTVFSPRSARGEGGSRSEGKTPCTQHCNKATQGYNKAI